MGTKLQRVHSMTKRPVSMGDADVHAVMHELERNLCDEGLGASPQLRACIMGDGWLPIASLINYTPLGNAVWPFGGMGVVADCLCTHGSMEVELSGDRACVRKKPLRVRLREQLEFIYADRNYCKDLHLQLLEDKEGFASLDMVCSTYTASRMLLQAVASPAACAALLREALDSSSELVHRQPAASEDGSGWVRRMSLVEKVTSQVEYYLNPARMAADQFLIEQAEENGGYVNIATLLSFPRLRKLVSPQIAAVAHVLSKSPKLEVSPNSALVRPRSKPPESPARAVLPANARAQVILYTTY
ncbi:hypothetical protein T492DRAFT_850107 [Pavlovales sp. CCMP2436]|nr:hypothetical protein T492DRAFT_850107 [Pavlovales sp. CCMP2436]